MMGPDWGKPIKGGGNKNLKKLNHGNFMKHYGNFMEHHGNFMKHHGNFMDHHRNLRHDQPLWLPLVFCNGMIYVEYFLINKYKIINNNKYRKSGNHKG